jgi:hypothetical protein
MRSLFLSGLLAVLTASFSFAESFTQAAIAGSPACSAGLPCNESTTSLGQFVIVVAPAFRPYLTGVQGYDPTSGLFISPLMYDSNTIIGLSAAYTDGAAPASLQVGTTGVVNGTNVTAVTETGANTPAHPAGFPTGNDAISTTILNVQLSGGGFEVNMGSSYPASGLAPGSPNLGEVESQNCNPGAAPCNDFPAKSFFDVFADITVPGFGSFSNTSPLVVQSTLPAPGSLPPKVLYTHGQSSSVGIFADTNEGPGNSILQGDQLGTFVLTGHGVQFQNTQPDDALFGEDLEAEIAADSQLNSEEDTFLYGQIQADDSVTPEPSTFVLLFSGVAGLLGMRRLRRVR